ncbi:MAG: helix-turn-helix domain-containing protein [Spirochaetaceae bacterium]|jgi:transcriptional regulator with XRE-family HTH domain|nr:helix-turn-helix domain-containing protein [Spirochaetaceae bacterium]
MENIREILANNIRTHRRRLGISQPRLAELADLSTHYVAMIETTRKFPTPEVLGRLAAALGIATHELFSVPTSPKDALERVHQEVITDIRAVLADIEKVVDESVQKALSGKHKT